MTATGRLAIVALALTATASVAAVAAPIDVTGWWLNPTPNNVWLRDGHSEFVVSEQGQRGADGNWPEFAARRFVATNGSYGYGCAAVTAVLNGKRVVRIDAAASLPLRRCRVTAALRKAEPRGR